MLQDILSTAAANIPVISNFFGAQADRNAAAHAARENYSQQKEFAQNGIQWKVEDAKKAGLHPLAALGASTATTGGTNVVGGGSAGGDLARSLGDMGQNVSRAVAASATADQREMSRLQIANARAELDGKVIDNQIRQNQLNLMAQTGPAFPSANDTPLISGQGNAMPGVSVMPSKTIASEKGRPGIQAGLINTLQYVREANGNIGIAQSEQAKERNEDDLIAETLWHFKNRLLPPAPRTEDYPIPPHLAKKGYKYWFWNPLKQEFTPSKNP
nr:MAG: DNA pilot protein [Microvirus sp.]